MNWRALLMLLMMVAGAYATWVFLAPGQKDGAAWIQCVWSIVAVSLAIITPGWPADGSRLESEHRRHMALLAELVNFADVHLVSAGTAKETPEAAQNFFTRENIARFTEARDALASFPVTVFNAAQEARDLMMVRAAMAETVSLLARGQSGGLNMQRASACCPPTDASGVLDQ